MNIALSEFLKFSLAAGSAETMRNLSLFIKVRSIAGR